jgi:hypothetical protein
MRRALTAIVLTGISLIGCGAETTAPDSKASPIIQGQETPAQGQQAPAQVATPPAPRGLLCDTQVGQTATLREGLFGGFSVVNGALVVIQDQTLLRVPLAGGDAATMALTDTSSAAWVLGDQAYFMADHATGVLNGKGSPETASGLVSVPLAGGDTVPHGAAPSFFLSAISDGQSLFFGGGSTVYRFTPPSTINEISLPSQWSVESLAAVGDDLYAAVQDYSGGGLKTTGAIIRVPKAGGEATALLSGIGHVWEIVADEGGLYWVGESLDDPFGPGYVGHAALDGRGVSTFSRPALYSIALDGDYLYGATYATPTFDSGNARLVALPRAGGAPITLATGVEGVGNVVIAGGNVIWANLFGRAKSETRPMSIRLACAPGATAR